MIREISDNKNTDHLSIACLLKNIKIIIEEFETCFVRVDSGVRALLRFWIIFVCSTRTATKKSQSLHSVKLTRSVLFIHSYPKEESWKSTAPNHCKITSARIYTRNVARFTVQPLTNRSAFHPWRENFKDLVLEMTSSDRKDGQVEFVNSVWAKI